jgi:hypothetical protein
MTTHVRHAARVALLLAVVGVIAEANVRAPANPPIYARVERDPGGDPKVFNDGEWAVIPFYRHSGCVPDGFNLLDFFDVPAAFGCHLRVEGFEIWDALPPPPGGSPNQVLTVGLDTMEIWFVDWSELSAAMSDDVLTIVELEALPSLLTGTATMFKETLHPLGGSRPGLLQMVGFGELQDGRSFRFSAVDTDNTVRTTLIEIG